MPQIRPFSRENFLMLLRNSLETTMFRNYSLEWRDVLEDGNLSCAYYASSMLTIAGYLPRVSFTVKGVLGQISKHAENFVWKDASDVLPGDIIVWDQNPDSAEHKHIGFYIGEGKAISNSSSLGKIVMHSFDYGGTRKIKEVFSILSQPQYESL